MLLFISVKPLFLEFRLSFNLVTRLSESTLEPDLERSLRTTDLERFLHPSRRRRELNMLSDELDVPSWSSLFIYSLIAVCSTGPWIGDSTWKLFGGMGPRSSCLFFNDSIGSCELRAFSTLKGGRSAPASDCASIKFDLLIMFSRFLLYCVCRLRARLPGSISVRVDRVFDLFKLAADRDGERCTLVPGTNGLDAEA